MPQALLELLSGDTKLTSQVINKNLINLKISVPLFIYFYVFVAVARAYKKHQCLRIKTILIYNNEMWQIFCPHNRISNYFIFWLFSKKCRILWDYWRLSMDLEKICSKIGDLMLQIMKTYNFIFVAQTETEICVKMRFRSSN